MKRALYITLVSLAGQVNTVFSLDVLQDMRPDKKTVCF
jgi:hypothetical protein